MIYPFDLKVRITSGTDIKVAATAMLHFANKIGVAITADFNGREMIALPLSGDRQDAVDAILNRYESYCRNRAPIFKPGSPVIDLSLQPREQLQHLSPDHSP